MPYTNKQANLDFFRQVIKPYAIQLGLKVVRTKGGWDIRKKNVIIFRAKFYDRASAMDFMFGYKTGAGIKLRA